jgi:hypothetical protein
MTGENRVLAYFGLQSSILTQDQDQIHSPNKKTNLRYYRCCFFIIAPRLMPPDASNMRNHAVELLIWFWAYNNLLQKSRRIIQSERFRQINYQRSITINWGKQWKKSVLLVVFRRLAQRVIGVADWLKPNIDQPCFLLKRHSIYPLQLIQ